MRSRYIRCRVRQDTDTSSAEQIAWLISTDASLGVEVELVGQGVWKVVAVF